MVLRFATRSAVLSVCCYAECSTERAYGATRRSGPSAFGGTSLNLVCPTPYADSVSCYVMRRTEVAYCLRAVPYCDSLGVSNNSEGMKVSTALAYPAMRCAELARVKQDSDTPGGSIPLSSSALPTQCPVLTSHIVLRTPYAMSGTDIAYRPTDWLGTERAYGARRPCSGG
eukprot:3940408-Rhodomonas_salina.1